MITGTRDLAGGQRSTRLRSSKTCTTMADQRDTSSPRSSSPQLQIDITVVRKLTREDVYAEESADDRDERDMELMRSFTDQWDEWSHN